MAFRGPASQQRLDPTLRIYRVGDRLISVTSDRVIDLQEQGFSDLNVLNWFAEQLIENGSVDEITKQFAGTSKESSVRKIAESLSGLGLLLDSNRINADFMPPLHLPESE